MTGRIVLAGGTLVRHDAPPSRGDLAMRDGVIEAAGFVDPEPGDEVVDVTGSMVLPGGVDPHVHFQTPSDGTVTSDTFTTGSRAAVFGGTTTALQFCTQDPGEPFRQTIARWREQLAERPSHADIGFHLMITDFRGRDVDELRGLADDGISSFKVFMSGANAVTSAELFRIMQTAADVGARVMVHAEDGASIDVLSAQALAAGRTGPEQHAATRPVPTEAAAVYQAIAYAQMTGASVYFVHLSSGSAVSLVAEARRSGLPVDGETCPQYLFFDESVLGAGFDQSAPYLFTPPPRRAADRSSLWSALETGELSTVASDHGGYCLHEKVSAADFTKVPQGILGIETRLQILHELGVRRGLLSWQRLVDLFAAAPARLFGLPQKGSLAVGADADVVVFDPLLPDTVSHLTHHSARAHTPYEGLEVIGAVTHTYLHGHPIVVGRRLVHDQPSGRLVMGGSHDRSRRGSDSGPVHRRQTKEIAL